MACTGTGLGAGPACSQTVQARGSLRRKLLFEHYTPPKDIYLTGRFQGPR